MRIELVPDLSNDLLNDILNGDEPLCSAVFIDDDSHLLMRRLHLAEKRDHVFRLRNEHRLVHEFADRLIDRAVHQRPDQVLVVNDTYDIINALMKDWQPRITRSSHALKRSVRRLRVLNKHDVDPRRADLACMGVTQIDDVLDHALFIVRKLGGIVNQFPDLLFRCGLTLAARDSLKEARLLFSIRFSIHLVAFDPK